MKEELKKISWTTKDELKVYTKIVVATTFIFGIVIYIADIVMQRALTGAGAIFRFFVG